MGMCAKEKAVSEYNRSKCACESSRNKERKKENKFESVGARLW